MYRGAVVKASSTKGLIQVFCSVVCYKVWNTLPRVYELIDLFEDNESLTNELSTGQKELINFVYMVYAKYSALGLKNMTHRESPWKSAYVEGANNYIDSDNMKEY